MKRAFDELGIPVEVVRSVERLERASRLILPHSDSFARAIRSIRDRGFIAPLMRAIDQGRLIFGAGHGLHLLFDVSYEEGQHTGLGVIPGKVTFFDFGTHPVARSTAMPHRGWNHVFWSQSCPVFTGLDMREQFYFDHSFHAEPLDRQHVAATCNHGIHFSAAVWRGPVFGVQFLPERSDAAGLGVLKNFASL